MMTNDGKFTPGPWEISRTHRPQPFVIQQCGAGNYQNWFEIVFSAPCSNAAATSTMFANVNLIVAAPELLKALEGIVARFLGLRSMNFPELDAARAAIFKATGKECI